MSIKVFCLKVGADGPTDLPGDVRFSRFNGSFRGRGGFERDGLRISSKLSMILSQEDGRIKSAVSVASCNGIGIRRGEDHPANTVLIVVYGRDDFFLRVLNYDAMSVWDSAGSKMTAFAAILRPSDQLIVALASGSVTYVLNRDGHVAALSDVCIEGPDSD